MAVTDMSDVLCLCFVMGSFYFFIKYVSGSEKSFLFFILFATAAFMTRYAAAIILFFPLIVSIKYFLKTLNIKLFLLSCLGVVLVFAPYYYFKNGNMRGMVQHYSIFGWDISNMFKRNFVTADGTQHYTLPNFIYCFSNLFSPGYFFAGFIVLFFVSKKHFNNSISKLVLLSWIAYSVFLGGIPFQNNRILLLSFPLVLIFLFPATISCWKYVQEKIKFQKTVIVLICLCQLALFTRAFIPFYKYNRTEKEIISEMIQRKQSIVYTSEVTAALHAYEVPQKVVDLWDKPIDTIEKPSLLLVNLPKFEKQWKGMNVMNNYNFIKANSSLTLIKTFNGGWELYEIR